MAVPFLIIDGYNLMHAAGMARVRYGPGDLERCRNRLLRLLAGRLQEDERGRTTVVFDARDAPADMSRRAMLEGIQIVFAESASDADTLIEQMLAGHSAPRQVLVISSDRRLHKAARRRKARPIDSETFVRELESRPGPAARAQPPPSEPPDAKFGGEVAEKDAEHWLKVFGDIPEAEELQRDLEQMEQDLGEFDPHAEEDDPRGRR